MQQQNQNIEIHETAFVISTFRSLNENLSGDIYAKLWNNSKTDSWLKEYLEEVSSEEVLTHCLRNRFFLEEIKKANPEVLINFGCGFSMYPFLLSKKIINVEIDKFEIITYKEKKIKEFQEIGELPERELHFIGVDFSENYQEKLLLQLKELVENKFCFILIEGVLFFLTKKDTENLFYFFSKLQIKGDYIGSASFQDSLKKTKVFHKLLQFFNKKVSKTKSSDWQTVEDEFYLKMPKYKLSNHQDYFSLSEKYKNKVNLDKDLILNENFYILKRTI